MSGFSTKPVPAHRPILLDLLIGRVAGRQSATAAVAMKHRGSDLGLHGRQHLLRRLHVDAHAARRGQMHRAGHQRDLGAGRAARAMAKPILPLEGW
jgi:hypothetical protein